MHRTVFLAALIIGVALSALSGCNQGHPYPSSTFQTASLDGFVVDGVSPTRTFTLDLLLDGPWYTGAIDASGLPADPAFSVRLDVENLQDEGVAPITARLLDSASEVLVLQTLDPAADQTIANLDARIALADCVPDTACEVSLFVEVARDGDAGAMFARLSASASAYGPTGEDPTLVLSLASAP